MQQASIDLQICCRCHLCRDAGSQVSMCDASCVVPSNRSMSWNMSILQCSIISKTKCHVEESNTILNITEAISSSNKPKLYKAHVWHFTAHQFTDCAAFIQGQHKERALRLGLTLPVHWTDAISSSCVHLNFANSVKKTEKVFAFQIADDAHLFLLALVCLLYSTDTNLAMTIAMTFVAFRHRPIRMNALRATEKNTWSALPEKNHVQWRQFCLKQRPEMLLCKIQWKMLDVSFSDLTFSLAWWSNSAGALLRFHVHLIGDDCWSSPSAINMDSIQPCRQLLSSL